MTSNCEQSNPPRICRSRALILQRQVEVLARCGLREDEQCNCGSTYDFLSPLTRLQLLHLLCCERLEMATAVRPLPEEEPPAGKVSTCTPSWRQVPIATDRKGRRYWYLGDLVSGNAYGWLFRSWRVKGKGGTEQPLSDEDADCEAEEGTARDLGEESSSDSDAGILRWIRMHLSLPCV